MGHFFLLTCTAIILDICKLTRGGSGSPQRERMILVYGQKIQSNLYSNKLLLNKTLYQRRAHGGGVMGFKPPPIDRVECLILLLFIYYV